MTAPRIDITPKTTYNKGGFSLYMTVDEVKSEVELLTLENIRKFPCTNVQKEDFYTLCNKFGIAAARLIMIPPIFKEEIMRPSEFFKRD